MSDSLLPPVTVEFAGNATAGIAAITKMARGFANLAKAAKACVDATTGAFAALEKGGTVLEGIVEKADAAKVSIRGLASAERALGKAATTAAAATDTGMASISAASERMAESVRVATATAATGIAEIRTEAVATTAGLKATAVESQVAAMGLRASSAETAAAGAASAGAGSKVKALGSKYLGLGAILSKLKTLGPLTLGAIAVASVDLGVKFDASIALLNTQADVAKSKLAGLSSGVLSLAGQVGFSPLSLSHALFHVESGFASMGITSAHALDITKIAAEGAAVGHADLIKTTTALTAVMASGYVPITQASQAMGVLNAMVGSGEMTMDDLTKAFSGGALAVVKGYGATIQDAGAALAVFGDNNIRGAQAGTMFRMAIQALAVPAKTAGTYLKEFGWTQNTLSQDMQKGGMKLALQDLETNFKKAGISAKEQGQVITEMFGKKAGAGIAVLLGQYDRLMTKYPAMDAGVNKFAAAWVTTKQTLSQQFKGIEFGLDAVLVRIGEKLIPQVSNLISLLESKGTPIVHAFASALSGIASGFGGATPKPLAASVPTRTSPFVLPGAQGPAASPFVAAAIPAAPKLTVWQEVGKVLSSVVSDLKRTVGDIAVAFGNLLHAAQPALAFLAGAGLAALKAMTVLLADYLGPALVAITGFMAKHKTIVSDIIDLYVIWKAATIALAVQQAILDAIELANPYGLVLIAIVALVAGLVMLWQHSQLARDVMTLTFSVSSQAALLFAKIFLLVLQQANSAFLSFAQDLLGTAATAFGWIPGIGGKLQTASNAIHLFKDTTNAFFSGAIKKVDDWSAAVAAMPNKVALDGQINGLTTKIDDAKKQLSDKNLPSSKVITLNANISQWQQQLSAAKMGLASTPSAKVAVLTATISNWQQQVDTATKQLANAPAAKQVVLTAEISDLSSHIAAAQGEINSLTGKTIWITYKANGVVQGTSGPNGYQPSNGSTPYAAGGIHIPGLRKAADGLMTRQAGFSNSPILWGEAGPEAYIPLSKNRQPRSRQIAAQTVGILGGQVQWGSGGKGAQGAMASYATLGAAIPAGVAAGVTSSAGAAHAAVVALAKGTVDAFSQELEIASPSKKFRSLGAYVIFGLVQGLTGSTASVKAATKHIASALYVAFGGAHTALQKTINRDNRALLELAARRDAVAVRLKAANANLASLQKAWGAEQKRVADSIMQSSTVVMNAASNGGWLSASQVVQNFAEQTQKALQFAGFLRQAQANGLNSAMISQIASSGVDAGYATAQALASANKSQISQLNQMQGNMQSAANGVGNSVADAMYGAGIKSAQGLVKGLQSQEKAIEAQMMRIALAMQKAIKKALGIRSPSKVFEDLGAFVPQGFAKGIAGGTHHATGAVMSMSSAVVSAGERSYAYSGARYGGGGGGSTVINITVNVSGHVSTERDLVDAIQAGLLRKGVRNSQTYQPFKR